MTNANVGRRPFFEWDHEVYIDRGLLGLARVTS